MSAPYVLSVVNGPAPLPEWLWGCCPENYAAAPGDKCRRCAALLQPGRQSNVMDVFLLALHLDYCPLYDTSLSCPECPYFGLLHGGRPR